MAHQHGHQGVGNTPVHHHDRGGLLGCGTRSIELVREGDRRKVKRSSPPASPFGHF